MIKIHLTNPKTGKKETFTQDYIKARYVRDGLKLNAEMTKEESDNLLVLEKGIDFIVTVMDNPKVTEDTILDGISNEEIWPLIGTVLRGVVYGQDEDESQEAGKQ
ncbi:phage tail assembly chaperone G [Listeria fleischmannii]|uniref:phage tail assembly chaperone G n=1 Tax=Listeria fleischmannii TaxID=1069827 RepID=UPI0016237EF7|nr:hypothetical protein [Listeria fleischmannii]MBC1420157.1 hypothetical protein [Listeria fleischmannii]